MGLNTVQGTELSLEEKEEEQEEEAGEWKARTKETASPGKRVECDM